MKGQHKTGREKGIQISGVGEAKIHITPPFPRDERCLHLQRHIYLRKKKNKNKTKKNNMQFSRRNIVLGAPKNFFPPHQQPFIKVNSIYSYTRSKQKTNGASSLQERPKLLFVVGKLEKGVVQGREILLEVVFTFLLPISLFSPPQPDETRNAVNCVNQPLKISRWKRNYISDYSIGSQFNFGLLLDLGLRGKEGGGERKDGEETVSF